MVVLEARDRIGGRICTDWSWCDVPIDLGASWVNGTTGNPLFRHARSFGLAAIETGYFSSPAVFSAAGKSVPESEWAAANAQLGRIMISLGRKRARIAHDVSLREAFDLACAQPSYSASQPLVRHIFHSTIEQEYAAEGSDLSLRHWDDTGEYRGADVILTGGLGGLAEKLADGLDIKLSHAVSAIEYDRSKVRVHAGTVSLSADYAVVTLPLGVLKNRSVTFSPRLPQAKIASLRKLTMGSMNKLFLRFPKRFWPTDQDWLEYMDEQSSQWRVWFNYFKYTKKPILVGFSIGAEQRSLEELTDREAAARGMGVLRRMFGSTIPAPTAWRVTRWASDPFSFGSYSHTPPGASRLDYDELAQPVDGRLFFAGEATHRAHFGSIHGAFLSGERAANQIGAVWRSTRRAERARATPRRHVSE